MLLIRIEPEDGQVKFKDVTRKSDGQSFSIPEQTVWVYGVDKDGVVDRYPKKSKVSLAKGQQPFPPGDYTVHPSCLRFNDYGSAIQQNLRLITVDQFLQLMKSTLFDKVGK